MVTKREVLEELTLPKLKRITQEMGIEVETGLAGFLGKDPGTVAMLVWASPKSHATPERRRKFEICGPEGLGLRLRLHPRPSATSPP